MASAGGNQKQRAKERREKREERERERERDRRRLRAVSSELQVVAASRSCESERGAGRRRSRSWKVHRGPVRSLRTAQLPHRLGSYSGVLWSFVGGDWRGESGRRGRSAARGWWPPWPAGWRRLGVGATTDRGRWTSGRERASGRSCYRTTGSVRVRLRPRRVVCFISSGNKKTLNTI